jgi:hypothetical protein
MELQVNSAEEYSLTHWMLRDLDVTHYWGKWKCAVEFADGKAETASFEWYSFARRHFLELGGCYLHERIRA